MFFNYILHNAVKQSWYCIQIIVVMNKEVIFSNKIKVSAIGA